LEKTKNGYKIVLTADRTLMSEYNGGIFLGFSACIPRGVIPDKLYFSLFCPSVPVNKDGSAKYAPCGTRKMEAEILKNGFSPKDIIVAHPDYLEKVVGPNTKVLCITGNDPLGMGPATSTFRQLFGGVSYMETKFKEILNNPAVKQYKPRIIVGGAGSWQLEDEQVRKNLGVDCVVIGEGEKAVDALFSGAAFDAPWPGVVNGSVVSEQDIPLIQNGTIDGIIEISRGCGRGCAFCVPTLQQYRCRSIESILKEVDVNLKAKRRPLLHAEDVLRYKAKGFEINEEAVKELFDTVYHHPGVKAVAISHFALSSVVSAPSLIKDLSRILDVKPDGLWMSGQCGIETGSPKLIRTLMAGKAKPFAPEEWPQVVEKGFSILNENNWVPVATLIIGLPGEEEEDTQLTIDLVGRLKEHKSLIVPLFMVCEGGLKGKAESFTMDKINRKQSELFLKCWEHNLDWSNTLIKEYYAGNIAKGYGTRMVFKYGVGEAKKLIKRCREDYNYDMPAMIKDAKSGKISVAPLPARLLYRVVKPKKN
jgi:radical SAM superfamily enzyme YgiQ (UPF0313 family)